MHKPAPGLDALTNIIDTMIGPDDAAVVVTYFREPLHVMIVPRRDADRASGVIARFLDEHGFGPEFDILIGTRSTLN